jgi:hypothetical protein
MPIQDWARVRANRFHYFHQTWTPLLAAALNSGVLPNNYLAMVDQITTGEEAAVSDHPVQTRVQTQADSTSYARKANRVTIRHPDGEMIAAI